MLVAMIIVMSCDQIPIEITLSHTRYLLTLKAIKRGENMDISDFILDIGEKIELVSGVELNFREKGTVPEEEWTAEDLEVMTRGGISLRTAEQTRNMDVVKLKKIDPCFQLKQRKIPCRVPECQETTVPHSSGEGRIKRDLFLCKTHREELADLISKRCAEGNVIVDVTNFKNDDFKGYTSLIAVLEKAFMHLKSKRLTTSATTDSQLAEVFLNARNILMITNALLNPVDENVGMVVNACLKILLQILMNPANVKNLGEIFQSVAILAFGFYAITYPWVMVSLENPGGKIGFGVCIVFLFLVVLVSNDAPYWLKILLGLLFPFAISFIGSGAYDWNLDPHLIERRRQHIAEEHQRLMAILISWFFAGADDSGNLFLKIGKKK
jgi:hypothetical protein